MTAKNKKGQEKAGHAQRLHPVVQAARDRRLYPAVQLHNSDCIAGMGELLTPASADLIVTSIPFEELFTYSGKPEDVGNNGSTIDIRAGRFALNMRFVVEGMFRVLKPGCNACIHIQQLLAYKVQHGFMGRRDFRGAMIEVFTAQGFKFVGEAAEKAVPVITAAELRELADQYDGNDTALSTTLLRRMGIGLPCEFVIPKNPQQMAQRLNLHSLQFKTGYARDGCKLAPAVNDYVLIFQKPGDPPTPPRPLYDAKKNPLGWMTTDEWVRYASGIWDDILEIDVLDGARGHKEEKQEKHVCPLQLEVIRRCIRLYTNPMSIQPDVTVLDPFMGIGSTAFVAVGGVSPMTKLAVEEPRNVVGFELKESYHKASQAYVARALKAKEEVDAAALKGAQPGLYDEVQDEAA